MMRMLSSCFVALILASSIPVIAGQQPAAQAPLRAPDVISCPRHLRSLRRCSRAAKVGTNDIVYDLGSGTAAFPLPPSRISAPHARSASTSSRSESPKRTRTWLARASPAIAFDFSIRKSPSPPDISESDGRHAVSLAQLEPEARPEIREGAQAQAHVLSPHSFDMGEWRPEQTIDVDGRTVYFWTCRKK